MIGFELCDPARGLYAAGGEAGFVISRADAGGGAIAAGAAPRGEETAGGGSRFEVETGEIALRAELEPLGPEAVIEGELVGHRRLRVCRALGELGDGAAASFASLGALVEQGPPPRAALRRSINILFGDGALLTVAAARPPGIAGHDAEEVVSALIEPAGGETRFARTLLSTEYDSQGRHRRATLELEPGPGEPPMRGAGRAIDGTWAELPDGSRSAFFSWGLEGRRGCGRYEVTVQR